MVILPETLILCVLYKKVKEFTDMFYYMEKTGNYA